MVKPLELVEPLPFTPLSGRLTVAQLAVNDAHSVSERKAIAERLILLLDKLILFFLS